jgi:hypothetical protein
MCRNITTLRGLEPAATPEEIEAAARQYVRKVSGVSRTPAPNAAVEEAVEAIAAATERLLDRLPPRRHPPPTLPPLRRLAPAPSSPR